MILTGVAVLSSVAFTALAVAKENPYQSIIDRNAFGLKPPPPPPTTPVEAAPSLQVKLTGVSNLGGAAKAFFQMTEPGPGKLPKWPPGMTTGEELDGVKVLSVDVDKGEVRIKNGAVEATLNFEKDGIKSPSAGSAATVKMVSTVPPLTLPPVRPAIGSPITPQPANRGVTVTGGDGMPGVGGFAVSGPGNALVTGGFGTPTTMGLAAVPTRSFIANLDGQVSVTGAGTPAVAQNTTQAKPQLTYEQSVLNVAVATELTRDLVEKGDHPPFPPTELTPDPPKLPGATDVQAQTATNVPLPGYNARRIR